MMSGQSYQQKRDQHGGHRCSWLKTQGRKHTRTLPTASPRSPCNFRVLLLVWEELWSLVRIIPAEVGLVAGGPRPLWTQGTCLNVLHSRVKEARSLSKKWGRETGNQKSHGLEIQTRGSGEVCIIHSQMS